MKKTKKNQFYTFLKIGATLILLNFVFTKIEFIKVWDILKTANILFVFIALCCFILSQLLSAERLNTLFRAANCYITTKVNYILYLIGMFYNFFIPGGIGGDAYKVYILHKEYHWSVKKLSAAVFIDRFIGLTAIGILLILGCFFIPIFIDTNLVFILPIILLLGLASSYVFVKRLFPTFLNVFPKSLIQSLLIQILQSLCIVALLASLSNTTDYIIYILVFLASSVLSVFSFSGIGIREMIFYQASTLFIFDSVNAITIGLLFSILTAFVSLFGLILHLKKPKLNTT